VTDRYEIHLTMNVAPQKVALFAERWGLKYTHIELARGRQPSQPMITAPAQGSLDEVRAVARRWEDAAQGAFLLPERIKIEAAPWNSLVPPDDAAAAREPAGRYFEHHVKLLLPDTTVATLVGLAELVAPHGAHLSRNARREHGEGAHERFVTQRCHRVGRAVATDRFAALLHALRAADQHILETEEEYVVEDTSPAVDHGWLTPAEPSWSRYEQSMRQAKASARDYPATYQPSARNDRVEQRAAFDPALKHYPHAYRAGEPVLHGADAARWHAARHDAMVHLLRLITEAPWGDRLVLRGSLPLRVWFGAAARHPGDLDFVVRPPSIPADGPAAAEILGGLVQAVLASPGPGLQGHAVTADDIWTYERAEGRRLVFPVVTTGVPDATVQVDVVFGEELPLDPVPLVMLPLDAPIAAAPPALALAWKLQWLATDSYPQGKDLYDAALLAEHTPVPLPLVRALLRPELADEADEFTAASVLTWTTDWANFRDEYPWVGPDQTQYLHRLARALERSSRSTRSAAARRRRTDRRADQSGGPAASFATYATRPAVTRHVRPAAAAAAQDQRQMSAPMSGIPSDPCPAG
jgi:hypothetical protein